MARIPDDEIERLKKTVPLETLCRERGVELKKHGSKDLVGRCPFHYDENPSFVVTPEKNLFHCLGCGAGGSVFDFVMKLDQVNFLSAVKTLMAHGSVASPLTVIASHQGTPHTILADPDEALTDADLLTRAAEYYHSVFQNKPNAMDYLKDRGCLHPDAVKHFRLGYANDTLQQHLPHIAKAKPLKARIQELGLIRQSGQEHLSGCVVFPIFDLPAPLGRAPNAPPGVVGMYGRRITRPCRNASEHLYLPGPHVGVWNAEGLLGAKDWLLCEALIDALSLWVHGFKHVTASYGVRGFTPDHWKLLRACKPERVLIAYDNDDAGNAAANELAQMLEPEGIQAWRVEPNPNTDINDAARRKNPHAVLSSLLAAASRLLPENQPPERQAKLFVPPPTPADSPPTEKPRPTAPPPSRAQPAQPEPPAGTLQILRDGEQAELVRGERAYRVRGLDANTSFDHLKVNLRLKVAEKFHLDTFDLYNARQRTAFIAAAGQITGAETKTLELDLAVLIGQLEGWQESKIIAAMKPEPRQPILFPEDEQKALALLRDPKIFEHILADFAVVGTVGEENNKLLGYLVTVSRKLSDPLSAIVISRSAAGKSSLLNALLDFVPPEEKEVMTAMTAQALFYLPKDGLAHKVLAVMEDEGSARAGYPLKILQSEKILVLAVTIKDPESGAMRTQMRQVDGPVAQLMTSTQAEIDYELANRYLVLTVDEEREQTRRIHAAQRDAETLTGLLRSLDRDEILKTHHNAQRMLRPLRVVNPYAHLLSFPDDQLRLRRDHKKYLGLIRAVAFLRQYQKPVKNCEHRGKSIQYITVDPEDLRLAHPLAAQALGRSLDELAPPTRAFLFELHRLIERTEKERQIARHAVRLSRREIREHTRWGEAQVRRHLEKLVELEYVLCHRVPGTAARYEYELIYDGQGADGKPFLPGLPDLDQLLLRVHHQGTGSEPPPQATNGPVSAADPPGSSP